MNLIAGCALNTPAKEEITLKNQPSSSSQTSPSYQGRLSLRVASDPPQAIFANFILRGSSDQGELALNSPLGNTLAKLTWTPNKATLQANSDTTEYPSTTALMQQVTGTTLPLAALFDWMAGKETTVEGWEIDFSGNNRFVAKRSSPLPTADLRVAIDFMDSAK